MKRSLPFVILLALLTAGCATPQNHYDPIESTNRVTDKINDGIDRISLKPAARGYNAIVPKPMRTAVSNFFDNTTYPNTVLNDFLQGKGGQGFSDLFRLLINSTLGVAGFVDVATPMGFERHEEDFGQTLATWGVGQGAYIVYPLLGPNSLRDTPDMITETATDPLFWAGFFLAPYVTIPVTVAKYIDKRSRLLEASNMRDELALDPYVFTREAWRQHREYLIYDGHPPVPPASKSDDGWSEVDFDSEDSPAPETSQPKTRISMAKTAEASTATTPAAEPHVAEVPVASLTNADGAANPENGHSYIINLSSYQNEAEAAARQGQLARLGIESEIFTVKIGDITWYRLRNKNRVSAGEAAQELQRLKELSGIQDAWLELDDKRK
ncbi:hypothetical protein FEF65_04630 [Mariprofundus erugo]|uniref:SPOR domain-containing protein n=1 Tax=Mariprofundus erugo TaxID=2528639 RepID=A0A5R9GWI9_9PROT|nr:MlaA family lipoprotein [Mariprofundus erugo]TLS68282.1 hypothetical protein FEF65_04630 [Mariprofundus erugo]